MKSLRKNSSSFLGNEQHIDFKEVCQLVNQINTCHLNSLNFLFPPGSQKTPSLSSKSKRIVIFLFTYLNTWVLFLKGNFRILFLYPRVFQLGSIHMVDQIGLVRGWAVLCIVGELVAPPGSSQQHLSAHSQVVTIKK